MGIMPNSNPTILQHLVPVGRRLAAVAAIAVFVASGCGATTGEEGAGVADLPSIDDPGTADATGVDDDTGTDARNDDDADGGGDDVDAGDDRRADEVDPDLAMAEFQRCMEEQGVEVQMAGDAGGFSQSIEVPADGAADGATMDEVSADAFEAASAVCDPILDEAFGSFELTPEQEAEMADQNLAFQRCLADRGFEIEMDGGSFQLGPEIDFDAFNEAADACGMTMNGPGSDG